MTVCIRLISNFIISSLFILALNTYAHSLPDNQTFLELLNSPEVLPADPDVIDKTTQELSQKFINEAQTLSTIKSEHQKRALIFHDKTMRFFLEKIGAPVNEGYPVYIALHGGGSVPSSVNDGQWEHMKSYYKSSVAHGIYIAPRAITDTWNLHSVPESYPLYERLIENLVVFEGADPNRIYFLGFSAGGDGVYQVVPRMPDRFAAANMSAGHHNNISFDNLYNVPFLLQVGEFDSSYDRNKVTARNYLAMNVLNQKYQGGFLHEIFMHLNYGHNGWPDNNAGRPLRTIVLDVQKWLDQNDRASKTANTNAIDWLNQYARNPLPTKVIWDLSTRAERTGGTGQALLDSQSRGAQTKLTLPHELFYWLDVSGNKEFPSEGKIVAELLPNLNTIQIHELANIETFRILLNPKMLNLSLPIHVRVGRQNVTSVLTQPKLAIMARTLLERGDKNYVFAAQITLILDKNTHAWKVTAS